MSVLTSISIDKSLLKNNLVAISLNTKKILCRYTFLFIIFCITTFSFLEVDVYSQNGNRFVTIDGKISCSKDGDSYKLVRCFEEDNEANQSVPLSEARVSGCIGTDLKRANDPSGANVLYCGRQVISFENGQGFAWIFKSSGARFFGFPEDALIVQREDRGALIVDNSVAKSICGNTVFSNLNCAATVEEFETSAKAQIFSNTTASDVPKSININPLPANCTKNSDNTFTCGENKYDAQGNLIVGGSTGAAGNSVNTTDSINGKSQSQTEDIIAVIFNLISAVLLIFVWLLSWVVFWVFWGVASIFLLLIRINPAGADFISVATEPWKIVVSIANLLILGSFVFIGFGYLLNISSIVKKSISEFMVNIIIVAVTINFTIFGAATFINITQGIGDVFVSGYAGTSGQTSENVVGKITNALNGVSYVRCGSLPDNAKGDAAESAKDAENGISKLTCVNNTDVGSQLGNIGQTFTEIGDFSGENVQRLLREFIYLMIILYAIVIFLKAIKMALLRVVGLWLLMIISPLALVAYFSPFDKLKKYGKDWVEYFWVLAIFYPAFIFGWILVGEMSTQFVGATQTAFSNEPTAIANVTANAQTFSETTINGLILVALAGIVTVALLSALIEFFDKTFSQLAKEGLKTLQDTVGSAVGTATGLYGGAIRTAGKLAPGAIKGAGALKDIGIARQIEKNQALIDSKSPQVDNKLRQELKDKNAELQKGLEEAKARREKRAADIQDKFQRVGDTVEYLPRAIGYLGTIPKNLTDNFAKQKEGRIARMDSRLRTGVERFARTNSAAYNSLKAIGYELDADPNLSNFTGVTPEVYKSLKNQGKGDYLDKEAKSLADKAFRNALGIKEQLDQEVLDILLDEYADQDIKGGKKPNISTSQLRQGLADPGQRNKILRNESLSKLVRDKYEQFNDPATRKIIQSQAPSLLPESQIADATRALSLDQIKELDPASADHPIVAATLQNLAQNNPEIASLINRNGIANGFSAQADERTKRELKLSNPDFANLSKDEQQKADAFSNGLIRNGLPNERDVISKLAQMKAHGDSDELIKAEYERLTQEFLNPTDENSGINKTLNDRNITDTKTREFIKQRAQASHISAIKEGGESAKETHFAKVQSISTKAAGHIQAYADGITGDSLAISTLQEVSQKQNIKQYLQDQDNIQNQGIIQALGVSGGVEKARKAVDRGEYINSNNQAYFAQTDAKTIEKAMNKYQKYATARIQGDLEARKKIAEEISNINNPEVQAFFTKEVETGTGKFWDNISNHGKEQAREVVDKAESRGGTDAAYRDALRTATTSRKKNISEKKEVIANAAKKEGADKIYSAMNAGEIKTSAEYILPDLPDPEPQPDPDNSGGNYNPDDEPDNPFAKPNGNSTNDSNNDSDNTN